MFGQPNSGGFGAFGSNNQQSTGNTGGVFGGGGFGQTATPAAGTGAYNYNLVPACFLGIARTPRCITAIGTRLHSMICCLDHALRDEEDGLERADSRRAVAG